MKFLLTAALVAAVLVFATAPPASQPTAPSPADPRPVAGAYHLHTTISDGALDRIAVARAASRAGLKFAIFTDHGNATRPPAPPEYIEGVLCVDGVEISTNDGHYVALGIGQAPYPLGGDADGVAEDVTRLGGFGIAAHPFSPRDELAWRDWTVPVDGLEWLNADSEWRDERRAALGRALIGYLVRPAAALASLLDRPVATLARWDQLAAARRVIALPGHDAHGGLGQENGDTRGRTLHLPSYEATFRSFSLRVVLGEPLTGNPRRDAQLVLGAIREGAVFSVIDAVAAPGVLDFHASTGGRVVPMGAVVRAFEGPATFSVRAAVPPGATTVLLRNGQPIAQRDGGTLEHASAEPGSYRVEILAPRSPGTPPVPWLSSNPIYRFPVPSTATDARATDGALPAALPEGPWRTEISADSTGIIAAEPPDVAFAFRLSSRGASPFVALVRDLRGMPDVSRLRFRGRASRPMRVSAQLRFADHGNQRWRKSFYVDPVGREVTIPIAQLRPADGAGPIPPVTAASSLLFVVDLTNASPGSEGRFSISALELLR